MGNPYGDWYPTPELRWHQTVTPLGGSAPHDIVLQQKWARIRNQIQSAGTQYDEEWRDVPSE